VPAEQTDQEILDELLAARRKVITRGAASYSINGRSFQAIDVVRLNELIEQYERKVGGANAAMFSGRGRFV